MSGSALDCVSGFRISGTNLDSVNFGASKVHFHTDFRYPHPVPTCPRRHYTLLHFAARHFECAPLFLLGGHLSFSGPCFSPFCKVRTPDSHELQSYVATSHMEMNM